MQIGVISKSKNLVNLLSQYYDEDSGIGLSSYHNYASYLESGSKNCNIVIIGRDCHEEIDYENNTVFIRIGVDINIPYRIDDFFSLIKNAIANNKLVISGFIIDPKSRSLVNDGREVDLTEKEFQILNLLVNASPEPIEKQKLLDKIFGYGDDVDTHTLETHIYRLRKKIGVDDDFIITEKGGYKIKVN